MYNKSNKSKSALCCCILTSIAVNFPLAVADSPKVKTYKDYPEWKMLPVALDYEDEAILARIRKLIDEGEACHEAMLAIVKECDDLMVTTSALQILRDTDAPKTRVVSELKAFFAERLPRAEGDEEWLMTEIALFLADFGTEDDMDVLLPMLDHPNWRVRTLGARYLGQSGGQRALDALKAAEKHDSHQRVQNEIDQAILRIEQRLGTPLVSEDSKAESEP